MKAILRIILVLVLIVASGCARKCAISGTVTRDGKPLEWQSEGGHLLVIFIPEDRKADTGVYKAETDRDSGTFSIATIPSGKYRVAIQQFDERHNDALGHVYDPSATQLSYEVTKNGQEIEIDLPKVLPKKRGAGGSPLGGKKE